MRISNPKEVAQYYQRKEVARTYINQRFQEPLNKVEHQRQVEIINTTIRDTHSIRILELAPGPARITAELKIENGISIDASASMLALARNRMKEKGKRWKFIQRNILTQRIPGRYDLVFGIRFLLHFKLREREKIYQQTARVLDKHGYLLFEALNQDVVLPLRQILGRKQYFIYDKLYRKQELVAELEANGFRIIKLYPLLNNFWWQALLSRPFKFFGMKKFAERIIVTLEKNSFSQPYEWMVLCQKK